MPYTQRAHNFFEAVAHGGANKPHPGLSKDQAAKMAGEGIKDKPKKLAKALRGRSAGAIGGAAIGGAG